MNRNKKRGQIPATLTWIVAFIVVVFIMAIFLSASLILIGKKKVSSGDSQVVVEQEKIESLANTDILFAILNTKIEDITIMDRIKIWKSLLEKGNENEANLEEGKIRKGVIDSLSFYKEGHLFYVNASSEGKIKLFNLRVPYAVWSEEEIEDYHYEILSQLATNINILTEDGKQIKVSFYSTGN